MLGKSKPEQHFELNLPHVDKDEHAVVAHPHPPTKAGEEMVIPPPPSAKLSAENIALIAIILLLLTAGLGVWSWMRFDDLKKLRQSETAQHEVVLDSLLQVKGDLESHLDQLQTAFTDLSTANDTLAQRLATATDIVAAKETLIREIKTQNLREEKALREQVQRLQTMKDRYETIIAVLDQKNVALMAENARLRGTTDSLSMEISDLGRRLEAQIRQTMSAQYKATSFRVEMERRNDKLTVRARRTRELNISFELNQVPAAYQGNQQIYLVITDDRGLPIASENPVRATIRTDKGNVEITAQATQTQDVVANQRIALSYKLEDRLKKGTYIVSVYSEKGLLGVASFRLT